MEINVLGWACPKIKKLVKRVANLTLKFINTPNIELTIKFVSPAEIKRLNREFRNKDNVTDVLSFPATNTIAGGKVEGGEGTYLGDMALCLKQAKTQAKEFNNSYYSEIQKLVIHSILHLLGYDHIKDEDYEVMFAKEQQIETALNKGEL